MGIVYHTHYLDWFEAARTEALRGMGLAYRDLEDQGVLMQVVEANVRFRGAARYDDRVEIETTLNAPKGVRIETEYVVRLEGESDSIVTGRVTLVCIDAARRRPIAPPPQVVALFRPAR